MKVLIIDNYDSFVYNLKQYFSEENCQVNVLRNDAEGLKKITGYDLIVLSPGPGIPKEAGQLMDVIRTHHQSVPILGICLGMQAIGEVFGGSLDLLDRPLHGCLSPITHNGDQIFSAISSPFSVGRYHSWVLNANTVSGDIDIISKDDQGYVMGIKHQKFPVYGLQFHPESVLTNEGRKIIRNFIKISRDAIDR